MKNNEFEELLREIGKGADIDQSELADALGYAGSAWYEIQQLTKSLAAGYARLGKDLERKNRIIENLNRTLTALRAEITRLREQNENYRWENEALKKSENGKDGGGGA